MSYCANWSSTPEVAPRKGAVRKGAPIKFDSIPSVTPNGHYQLPTEMAICRMCANFVGFQQRYTSCSYLHSAAALCARFPIIAHCCTTQVYDSGGCRPATAVADLLIYAAGLQPWRRALPEKLLLAALLRRRLHQNVLLGNAECSLQICAKLVHHLPL